MSSVGRLLRELGRILREAPHPDVSANLTADSGAPVWRFGNAGAHREGGSFRLLLPEGET